MGGLFKKAAPVVAGAAGGPLAAGLASFGTEALSGGDLYSSVGSGMTSGALSGMGDIASGGTTAVAGTPLVDSAGMLATPAVSSTAPSFGTKMLSGFGFGSNPWENVTAGGNLLLSLRNPLQPTQDQFTLPTGPQRSQTLLDLLNERAG